MAQGVIGDMEIMALIPEDFRVQGCESNALTPGAFGRQHGRFFFLGLCLFLLLAGLQFLCGKRRLLDGPFIGEVPVNPQPPALIQIVDTSAVIGKAVLALHRSGHILLRRLFRLCQRLVIQPFVKSIFKVVVHRNFVGRLHALGVAVDVLRGKPFRFFRQGGIEFPHFGDLFPHVPGPQMLFRTSASAQEVVAVGFQAAE